MYNYIEYIHCRYCRYNEESIMKKICRMCGQEFETKNGRQQDCGKPIIKVCEVCGKEFEGICSKNDVATTCSTECRYKRASLNRQKSYMKETKICELCGAEFHPRSNTQKVCEREHFSKCIVCGKEFKINYKPSSRLSEIRQTCSNECLSKYRSENNPFSDPEVRERIKETMKEKYGVEHAAQDRTIQAKMHKTMLEKYGVEYAMQNKELRDKIKQTNQEKYGADWALQSDSIKEKLQSTFQERYGVNNAMQIPGMKEHFMDRYKEETGYNAPMQNPEVKEKSRQFYQDNYGVDHVSQTQEFKDKFRATSLKNYGTENPMQSEEVKAKVRETSLHRYGSTNFLASEQGRKLIKERMEKIYGKPWHSQTAQWKEQMIIQCSNLPKWMEFTNDPVKYLEENYKKKPKYRELSRDLGVPPSTVNDFVVRRGLRDHVEISTSYMEEEVKEFLESLEVTVELHNRKLIAPLEIDLFLPEYNVGIECNPTATHNSSFYFMDNEDCNKIDYKYHQNKTEMCEKKGIFLFHIFGYEWEHRQDVIKSMLRNIVSKNENIIYARKCIVKEVDWEQSMQFLETNHRQGSASSPVRLGLYYNDELVSLMTFGKMRSGVGTGLEDLSNCWELVRFCSNLNTSVVGGASKLFNYFLNLQHPHRIRSFSDRAHTSGKLYSKLKFVEINRSDPGYVWVDIKTDKAYNRVNAQKQNIQRFLNDDSIDLTQTEAQIMEDHGFARVFDSGTITWEWNSNTVETSLNP